MKISVAILCLLMLNLAWGQDVKIEYDKTKDFSAYKTFRFGESEIVTPKEKKQISDAALNKIIRDAIEKELAEKGIIKNDSSSELVITYLAGIFEHSERQNLGPLGTAPGQSSQTWTNNYSQGELIIDINDVKSRKLIWRVNSQTNTSTPEAQTYIEQVVDKGLKKFAVKPKGKKKK
jgi:predicted transcriptional regulator